MEKRNLGKSGLLVSLVGLGCNNFGAFIDAEASRKVMTKRLTSASTLFDTADIYGKKGGSETILGQLLGERRKNIVLATKFGLPMDDAETLKGASRRYIFSAIEASLRRLENRLDRPLPDSPSGSADAHGRDTPRAGRSSSTRARFGTSVSRTTRHWKVADARLYFSPLRLGSITYPARTNIACSSGSPNGS